MKKVKKHETNEASTAGSHEGKRVRTAIIVRHSLSKKEGKGGNRNGRGDLVCPCLQGFRQRGAW